MRLDIQGWEPGQQRLESVVTGAFTTIFDLSTYTRSPFNSTPVNNPYVMTNSWMRSLSPNDKDKIEEVYLEAHVVFGTHGLSKKDLVSHLNKLCIRLLDIVPYEQVHTWVVNNPETIIPTTIKEVIDDDLIRNGNGTIEQTYLVNDYMHLLAFTVMLRLTLPILGEYRFAINDNFNKIHGFKLIYRLLEGAKLLKTPAVTKIKAYIDKTTEHIEQGSEFNDLVMVGVPRNNIRDWLFMVLLTKRLVVCPYGQSGTDAHLITCMHKAIRSELDGNKVQHLKTKQNIADTAADSKSSILEQYKLTTPVSEGDIIEMEYFARDTDAIIEMFAPDIDRAMLADCIKSTKSLQGKLVNPVQVILVRWVLNTYLGSRTLDYVTADTLYNLMGVTSALLKHYGYDILAVLVTAVTFVDTEQTIRTMESRSRVPKELLNELYKWYPYHNSGDTGDTITTSDNYVVDAINLFVGQLEAEDWYLTASPSFIRSCLGINTRRPQIPGDIKSTVIKLIIDVGSRRWTKEVNSNNNHTKEK